MVFIIGDIHGMLDCLKNLIWKIENSYKDGENIDELIFLGDYIDYGSNSKEVIDYITALPYKKTFLAGNHEDLLLQFFHKDLRDRSFSESYWLRNNEGYRTIRSFTGTLEYGITPEKASEKIERKYIDFFEKLLYIYEKEIDGQKYLFSHGHIDENMLDKFSSLEKYDKFHTYLLENDLSIYSTPIWERKDCRDMSSEESFPKVRDYIIVHGHTPVSAMSRTPDYVRQYQAPYIEVNRLVEAQELKMAEYIGEESEFGFDVKTDEIYGINIDTGISIGHGISALGIKTSKSSGYYFREDEKDKGKYTIIQARSDAMNKLDAGMRYYKYILNK